MTRKASSTDLTHSQAFHNAQSDSLEVDTARTSVVLPHFQSSREISRLEWCPLLRSGASFEIIRPVSQVAVLGTS